MKPSLIYLSLTLAIGIAIGVSIQHEPEKPGSVGTGPAANAPILSVNPNAATGSNVEVPSADLEELNRLLQTEIIARKALEIKLAALSQQVAAFGNSLQSFQETEFDESAVNNTEMEASRSNQEWFNQQALLDNGMDYNQASELRVFFEQLEMERLYLRDQSVREDWNRDQLREAMRALDSREIELKTRLGESAYDSYLYASGRPNRVAVTSVLESAQAGTAGIKPGDHIIRYDNQRIYNWRDLREATAGGSISDTVALEVERDGETIEFYLARGPLGIRMDSVSVAPKP